MVRTALLLSLIGCTEHAGLPATRPHDARAGLAPASFDPGAACGHWLHARGGDSHASFPEMDITHSCFVPVHYEGETVTPESPKEGCGYRPHAVADALVAEATRYERIARGEDVALPLELACNLPDRTRRAAAANNARTLRALAADDRSEPYAYATIEAFGYGHPSHAGTALDTWAPGDACPRNPDIDLHRFSVNVNRAGRASLAYAGHVAPVIVVSGGAVHSRLVEAFLLDYIATCRIGVPHDRVLVDPCANHTHTNVRNAGRLVQAVAGRTAYIVTDDSFQAIYLQEWTLFDLMSGSIDQRALRDWGYLIGSWRQASVGINAGFWYTPYRFWADARHHDFSCTR